MTEPLARIPGRRPFQFGLRTMFVAVAILALGLSWELRIVEQRKALRASIVARGGQLTTNVCPYWMGKPTSRPELFPQWRRWLGDRHADAITFAGTPPTDAEIAEARRLFPEAFLYVANASSDSPVFLPPD
jgi:hypothetical protein